MTFILPGEPINKDNTMLRSLMVAAIAAVLLISKAEAQLAAHVDVTTGPSTWAYTLFNDEPSGSPNFLSSFGIAVDAPIVVTSAPDGWNYQTDGSTYVLWSNTDIALPYPHDVAPNTSLSGFSIQSTANTSQELDDAINSWDHVADAPGPGVAQMVLVPSVVPAVSSVPEASPLTLLALGLTALALPMMCARRRRTVMQ